MTAQIQFIVGNEESAKQGGFLSPGEDKPIKREPFDWDKTYDSIQFGNWSNYEVKEFIGKGAFGSVHRGIHIPTGEQVAIKYLIKGLSRRSLSEIVILQELKDAPNILPLRDVIEEKGKTPKGNVTLIFEYLKPPSIDDLFRKMNPFALKMYIYQTLRTLEYAHSRGIFHRDLKPLNILMDVDNLNVKVIDWNHGEYYEKGMNWTVRIATLQYKAPELLMNNTYYDYGVDIWAVGVTLAELMFQKYHVFQSNKKTDAGLNELDAKWQGFGFQLDSIAEILGSKDLIEYVDSLNEPLLKHNIRAVQDHPKTPWKNLINQKNEHLVDDLAIDLLEKMLVYNQKERITVYEALKHPYFDTVKSWEPGMPIPE